MFPKPSFLGGLVLTLGALACDAPAQEQDERPITQRGRRDPFANPMHPKETPGPIDDSKRDETTPLVPDPVVEKPSAPAGEDRAAVVRRFAARGVRVQGIIHEVVPTTEPLAAGVCLLGRPIRAEILARVHLPVAHALVQVDAESRMVSAGDAVAADLRILRISRTEVVFLFHGAEVAVPVGANGV